MSFFRAENLSIEFGGLKALSNVGFEVKKGEIHSIIGPNGAGKTTMLNIISRIYNPSSGNIFFEARNITKIPTHKAAGLGIVRTFQNIELFERADVLHNLLVGRHRLRRSNLLSEMLFAPSARKAEIAHRKKAEEVIDFLDLQPYRQQLIANLPYGIRKVVELGRALCAEPKLLLLDEPSSGLNVEETEDMSFRIEDIKKMLGVTIVMVEHNMSLVSSLSDATLALSNGKTLAQGDPLSVRQNPEVIKAYLGEEPDE